jgi:L-histidine Nalpha-methyltransferase
MAVHQSAASPIVVSSRQPTARFREDVLNGLSHSPKDLPCKYFYDERGSHLFDLICELPEYYLTRTELSIMRRHAAEMADELGPECLLVEYGSGSGIKTPLLLEKMDDPVGYVPVDISREHLGASAAALSRKFPDLNVTPLWADFTRSFELPPSNRPAARNAVYFPGSTIGNFAPTEAVEIMKRMAKLVGEGGALLIGVDLRKPAALVEPAYNDNSGVTAAFNLNLLVRINRELGADFELTGFAHRAFFNERHSRIEMHLMSLRAQVVRLGHIAVAFNKGESIRTEFSYKYSPEAFREMANAAGFNVCRIWMDEQKLFSVQYLVVAARS